MLRRPSAALLAAHIHDPGRRELYVEGVRDRAFLYWLIGNSREPDTSVIPIDAVEIAVTEGGNRERLRAFLLEAEKTDADIKGLVDNDNALLIPEELPGNAYTTDLRDVESYVLSVENVEAALRLGYGIERGEPGHILRSTFNAAAYLTALRLASHALELKLKISKYPRFNRYVTSDRFGTVAVDEPGLTRALLQSANVSLRRLEEVIELANSNMATFEGVEPLRYVRGKDCVKVLQIQFEALGARNESDISPALWTSFRRERLTDFPQLQEVVSYLTVRT